MSRWSAHQKIGTSTLQKQFRETGRKARRTPASELPSLRERLQKAEVAKEKAKELFRKGKVMEATLQYVELWGYLLLPYSTLVLAPSDPNRAWLGRIEASVWCNLSAAFAAILEKVGKGDTYYWPRIKILTYLSAWHAWMDREFATVGVVRNACIRLEKYWIRPDHMDLIPELLGYSRVLRAYWADQSEALKDLPKDMAFRDVDPEFKIDEPEDIVLKIFGHFAMGWDSAGLEG
ncbi:hypothetical protein IAT38_000965 [Cryptococcus sp. DSM 104549]